MLYYQVFQTNDIYQCKMLIVYNEDTSIWENISMNKYTHNVTNYGVLRKIVPWWCNISHNAKTRIYCLLWFLLMLIIEILSNVSIKDRMFITSTIWNSKQYSIAKNDSNWAFEEAWLLVLDGHPQYSPLLATKSNLNTNKLLYMMSERLLISITMFCGTDNIK